jgi:hypothetical protein
VDGGRKSLILLEVSQASPSRPSDASSVEVKVLGWLEVGGLRQGSRNSDFMNHM